MILATKIFAFLLGVWGVFWNARRMVKYCQQEYATRTYHLKCSPEALRAALEELCPPKCVSGRWHPEFTDITANGADKGKGILAMAKHEGFNPNHTIAFGDGGNDTSMILQAGIGVAMGNAIDELKQQADYVTTTVDDYGILNALRHLEVI